MLYLPMADKAIYLTVNVPRGTLLFILILCSTLHSPSIHFSQITFSFHHIATRILTGTYHYILSTILHSIYIKIKPHTAV